VAPSDGQLWRQTDMSAPQNVLQWDGTRWVQYG
jgi:hypothetical protein